PDVVLGSALTGQGLDGLLAGLDRRLATASRVVELELDAADGARLAWLYRHGTVLTREELNGRTRLRVALEPSERDRLARHFPRAAIRRPGRENIDEPG
ncbi:MAG: hypothetical protein ACREH3_10130, partial [Geminicoccales bacterium]